MAKPVTPPILTERLREHPAFEAWRSVQSNTLEAGSIEILKRKTDSAVYRLNGVSPCGAPVIAKWCRQAAGNVERAIYEQLLPRVPVPSLRCHGLVRDPDERFCWLFLEDAGGSHYSRHAVQHRVLAGQWLAQLHLATLQGELQTMVPSRELAFYVQLLDECRTRLLAHLARTRLSAEHAALFRQIVIFCDAVESQWSHVEKICRRVPRALVHGDFVIKNLRVQHGATALALLVFDWQFAGWGVPAADLAQLIDRVATPDLEAYRAVLNRGWPRLEMREVERVATCGNLLRVLHQIDWAMIDLRVGDAKEIVKAASLVRVYEATFADALDQFKRSCA